MPLSLSRLLLAGPAPLTPDADLLIRFHAVVEAARAVDSIFTELRSHGLFDLAIIPDPDSIPDEQVEALERLAQRLERRWQVHDPRVRDELTRRAKAQSTTWTQIKLEALRTAIWLILCGEMDEPHQMCFSPEGWLVDQAGHRLAVVPNDLPIYYSDRWSSTRIIKQAEAHLLDLTIDAYEQARARQAREDVSAAPPQQPDDVVDTDADPLYHLLELESAADAAAEYAVIWRHATSAQRRLLTAWRAQLAVGGSMATAARAVGIAENTAYVQLSRLRATLRTRRPGG